MMCLLSTSTVLTHCMNIERKVVKVCMIQKGREGVTERRGFKNVRGSACMRKVGGRLIRAEHTNAVVEEARTRRRPLADNAADGENAPMPVSTHTHVQAHADSHIPKKTH